MEIESAPKQSESEGKGKKMDIEYEPEKNIIKDEIWDDWETFLYKPISIRDILYHKVSIYTKLLNSVYY